MSFFHVVTSETGTSEPSLFVDQAECRRDAEKWIRYLIEEDHVLPRWAIIYEVLSDPFNVLTVECVDGNTVKRWIEEARA